MKLHQLPKITAGGKKRVGRGYGSGKGGHTSGRGQKGQKTRGKVKLLFEGTKVRKSFVRRMPMLRGKKKLISLQRKPMVINLQDLNVLPKGGKVNRETLIKSGIVRESQVRNRGIKILGKGKIAKPLTVQTLISQAAKKKLEKAGGRVEVEDQIKASPPPEKK